MGHDSIRRYGVSGLGWHGISIAFFFFFFFLLTMDVIFFGDQAVDFASHESTTFLCIWMIDDF